MKTIIEKTAVIILLLISNVSISQTTITIGSGTATSTYYPIYQYFGYNYSQQLYYSAEIGSSGTISKIYFYSNYTTLTNSNNWTIYMGNTSKTAFTSSYDWVPATELTQVYTGNLSTNPGIGWIEITLDTPFEYTGDNLVVAVDENTAGYGSSSASWYVGASGSNYRSITYYSDGTNPNPSSPPSASVRSYFSPQIKLTVTLGPMAYSSCTTNTASTSTVNSGTSDNEIIRLNVVTTGSTSPLSVSSVTFNTSGTTSPGDLSNAKVYYTTSTTFSTGTQFGSTTVSPSGSLTFTGTQELASGNNYFWLAYDIASDASSGNIVDAQCTSVTIDGIERTPTETNPSGNRNINYKIWYANASTGNDATGDGSASLPYMSFHKTYTMASAGDMIDLTGTFDWTNGSGETGDTYVNDDGYILTKSIQIRGQAADQTIIQANNTENNAGMRIFTINSAINVTIERLSMRYGYVSGANGGGALYVATGNLTLNNCRIHNNRAWDMGGGGINHYSGTLILNGCTVDNNSSLGEGGGIYHSYGTIIITNSTIAYNNMYGSTGSGGGGIQFDWGGSGGTITNSTIAYNTINGSPNGAGLNSDFTNTYLKNNIIIGNRKNVLSTPTYSDYYNSGYSDFTYNCIIEAPTGYHSFSNGSNGNIVGTGTGSSVNVNLNSVLALNSSLNGTLTLSLGTESVALNAGTSVANNGVSIPAVDQRGITRTGTPDIGAYEGTSDPVVWNGDISTSWSTAGNWSTNVVPPVAANIVISASASRDIALTQNQTISSLDFNGSDKKIIIGNYDLVVTNISGANSDNFIKTDGTGKLQMSINNLSDLTFPIGNTNYSPITITNKTGINDNFSVRVFDEMLSGGLTGEVVSFEHIDRTWDISNTSNSTGSGTINLDLVYSGATNYTGTKMLYHFNSVASTWECQMDTTEVVDGVNLTYTGYSGSFSPFAIGNSEATLPVSILTFRGNQLDEMVMLNWTTSSEINNDYFSIEKSTDGINFFSAGTVKGAGNSNAMLSYNFDDREIDGQNIVLYYRLKLVDFDGKYSFSNTIAISLEQEAKSNSMVYPNPVKDVVNVLLPVSDANFEIDVYSSLGQIVFSSSKETVIDVSGFNNGIYFLSVKQNDHVWITKIIK